jgi:hypothetical protein
MEAGTQSGAGPSLQASVPSPPQPQPGVPPGAPPRRETAETSLLPRMIALVALGAAANLWSEQHLGLGIHDPKLLGAAGAALAAGTGLLDKVAGKAERESFGAALQRLVRPLLATPVLAILYLSLAIVAASYSSLSILPESGGRGSLDVRVVASEDPSYERRASGQGPLRIPLRVTSFGRAFRVECEGYLPRVVEVGPLWGARLVAGVDLKAPPSVLLRPSLEALRSLDSGGTLTLWKRDGDERVPLGAPVSQRSSFLVGPPRPIPAEASTRWQLELTAARLEPAEAARVLLEWGNPARVELDEPLLPGMWIEAEVRTRSPANRLKARAEFEVGEQPLTEIALPDVRSPDA